MGTPLTKQSLLCAAMPASGRIRASRAAPRPHGPSRPPPPPKVGVGVGVGQL